MLSQIPCLISRIPLSEIWAKIYFSQTNFSTLKIRDRRDCVTVFTKYILVVQSPNLQMLMFVIFFQVLMKFREAGYHLNARFTVPDTYPLAQMK